MTGLLIAGYRRRGVLVDTNLLLLFFMGCYRPSLIAVDKRTSSYKVDDFELLARFLGEFAVVLSTPNILTEVSNLGAHLPPGFHGEFARRIDALREVYQASAEIAVLPHFDRFGLTDAGIVELARGRHLLLTDDRRLAAYASNVGVDAIDFAAIRTP